MPALAAILAATTLDSASVLKTTSATVGVTTTLSPDGHAAPGVLRWVDRSGGIQVGYPSLTVSMRRPNQQSRATRVTMKLTLPTLAVTAPTTSTGLQPLPQKAYEHSAIVDFYLPEAGTVAERQALFSTFLSLFVATITASDGNPTDPTVSPFYTMITSLEPVYSA